MRPGHHQIALVRALGGGQSEVLDELTVTVLEPTPEQEEYRTLMAARKVR